MRSNAREETGLKGPMTKEPLEIDILLPSLKLAFDYQVPDLMIFGQL